MGVDTTNFQNNPSEATEKLLKQLSMVAKYKMNMYNQNLSYVPVITTLKNIINNKLYHKLQTRQG